MSARVSRRAVPAFEPVPRWFRVDSDAARDEGWDIFDAAGSAQNEDGRSPLQLQRMDEDGVFESDMDAWAHVLVRAAFGSPLHARAISYLQQHSPGEIAYITSQLPHAEAIINSLASDKPTRKDAA